MIDRKKQAYEFGRDAVINGANTTNCNFKIFESELLKGAWQKGHDDAKRELNIQNIQGNSK